MAIATMTESCPGVEQSSIQGGKLPSSSRSIKSGAMHLAPAPDIKELSNFLLLERSGIQVWQRERLFWTLVPVRPTARGAATPLLACHCPHETVGRGDKREREGSGVKVGVKRVESR